MKKVGIAFVVVGLFLIMASTTFTLTGNVVNNSGKGIQVGSSIFGIAFLVVGLASFLAKKEGNLAKRVLESGAVVDTKKLIKLAKGMGYEVVKGYKEGARVYDGEEVITVIPKHKTVEGKGTYLGILKALSTGESSFRKRNYG